MLELLDLSRAKLRSSAISEDLLSVLEKIIWDGKRALIWMNRRGTNRAFLCEDCGHMFSCSRCDLPMAIHTSPRKRLLCHHCSLEMSVPYECPHCAGTKLKWVGVGIQEIERGLKNALPKAKIIRLDSDAETEEKNAHTEILESDIVIATEIIHKIDAGAFELVAFPLLENELSANDFDTEERLYMNVRFALSYAQNGFIQTYSPTLPIIKDIFDGNYKTFLARTLAERNTFKYPPYSEIAYIRVADRNETKVFDTIAKLKNKLEISRVDCEFEGDIFFDSKDIYTKRNNEYIGKIVIKGIHLDTLLDTLRLEILRNPHIRLERK